MTSRVAEEAGAGRGAAGAGGPGLISAHPVLAVAAGTICIAPSAILVRVSGTSPATAAVFRCLYAIPFLAVLAWAERRGRATAAGKRETTSARWLRPVAAGVFFAVDLVLWHHAIGLAGAGIATVLGNLQVIFVGLGAWAAFGERPGRRLVIALPVVIAGVTAISGVVGAGAYGPDPARAVAYCVISSAAYAAFILVLRGRGSGQPEGRGPECEPVGAAALAGGLRHGEPPRHGLARGGLVRGGLVRGGLVRGGLVRGGLAGGGLAGGGLARGGLVRSGLVGGGRRAGRSPESDASAGPLLVATAVAAAASAGLGVIPPGVDLIPSWPAHGWLLLLALTSQVAGWSLISRAMRLLPAALTALLLLMQPVMAVALSMLALGERPSAWQLAGCALVLAGVMFAATRPAPVGAPASRPTMS